MRGVLRVLSWLVAVAVLVVVAAAVAMWVRGGRVWAAVHEPAGSPVVMATDSLAQARGERLARTRGCFGCHGPDLAGQVFVDEPGLVRLVASNLTHRVPAYTDAELERLLRHGVRPDGRGVFAMPSSMYQHLSDADVADLMAWLRTLPAAGDSLPPSVVRWKGRLGLAAGMYQSEVASIVPAAERVPAPAPGDTLALGRYVAMTTCTECHGADLHGSEGTPSLVQAQAYTLDQFAVLLAEGRPLDGRDLELMDDVARSRFVHLTSAEVAALHAWLGTLPAAPESPPAPAP